MLKQIIPTKLCLSCDVCCRFIDKDAALRPLFLPHEITSKIKPHLDKSCRVNLAPFQDMHACAFFNAKHKKCSIYSKRPFDCQLYPFTIMFDENREKIILGIDKKCPFAVDPENHNIIKDHFHYLVDLLEGKEMASLIAKNPLFIGDFQGDVIRFSYLDTLTKLIINNPEKNGFKQISLKDKAEFDNFFKDIENPDSSQNFINLYIWKDKNPVWWTRLARHFAMQNSGRARSRQNLQNKFWRKKTDKGMEILIEMDSGYVNFNSLKKFPDYVYLREDLASLKGTRYKHKRASCNHFSKNYKFQYLPYKESMKKDCLKLFLKWASERKKKFPDLYYHKLLEDSFSAHKLAMDNFKALGLTGRVIKIKNKIAAYTFGFEVTPSPYSSPLSGGEDRVRGSMFCILLEACDLKFKGISEFIFREFSREMNQYKYINTMDDSGLENLRIFKLSYHPIPTTLQNDNVKM